MTQLLSLFSSCFGAEPSDVSSLHSSGSDRKYYRLSAKDKCCVGVESGNIAENQAFCYLARHFAGKGIRVPKIFAESRDGKAYLQEDLGSTSLFDAVAQGREKGEYSSADVHLLCKAMYRLPKIQFAGAMGMDFDMCHPLPSMDKMTVMFDLNYFKYCYLKCTGIEFNEVDLQYDFERLATDLLEEKFDTFMYRDFQTRNVMLVDGEPYFIDFQGGYKGPIYYDVASFIWQAASRFPAQLKGKLVDTYLTALEEYRLVDKEEFLAKLRLFSLFRMLQVLGAYGFRGNMQRKAHFLHSIPFALANVRELLEKPFEEYPYLTSLLNSLASGKAHQGGDYPSDKLTITVTSFSYRKGIPEDNSGNGGGYVFDCRGLINPGRYERYQSMTGQDKQVIEFIEQDSGVPAFMDGVWTVVEPHIQNFISRGFSHLSISFGCTGGRHRSVYCAESFARHLAEVFGDRINVELIHREHPELKTRGSKQEGLL